jgi:glucuronokinase
VPVSVGLAGSSALAVGVIEAAAACWGHRLDPRVVAALALSCEVDLLGVAAGWQDRVVQAHRAVVLVDAGRLARVDGLDVPTVTSVHPVRPARFVVGWAATGASSSGDYHGALRDPGRTNPAVVRAGMGDLADLARAAATSLATGDLDGLGRAIDLGWATRQQIAPLRADHAALVEAVREIGAPATTPGSGGAVVALARTATDEDRLGVRLDALGAAHLTVELS